MSETKPSRSGGIGALFARLSRFADNRELIGFVHTSAFVVTNLVKRPRLVLDGPCT